MCKDPILSHQRSAKRIRVFIKQAIMSYTQTDHDIKVRPLLIQHFGLHYRIAHVYTNGLMCFIYADRNFWLSTYLTCGSHDFKSTVSEYLSSHTRFPEEPDTCSYSQFLSANLRCELADFFNACHLTVVFELHFRCSHHYLSILFTLCV